ncbi:Glutathione-regulated potassium-efflux system protein KefC [bioreactor metagenome]|uniref:Glutathione-regulated potassium-efflux system protein KefC n=1 Tax=bioreactor metagenome TaxID=1076179 RepID=A0A645EDJ1_9ZZZZ
MIVVAVDEPDQTLKIVQIVKKHFPHLQIVARARDVTHWNQLRDLGVEHVERELFESSLVSGRTVMELIGLPPEEATYVTERFREHNIALANLMYEHHDDSAQMIAVARKGRAQLVEQMARERQEREAARPAAQEPPATADKVSPP